MTEEIKEKLIKTIKISCNDKKKNAKFLIFFTEHQSDEELVLNITDGVDCWQSNKLDENCFKRLKSNKSSSINNFSEFLDQIDITLKLNKFEIIQFDNEADKLEIKFFSNEINFVLSRSSSSKIDIKNLLFSLFAKYSKLEENYNKFLVQNNGSNSHNTNIPSSSSNDSIKRFNLGASSSSTACSRKQGYSIINPLNKRRKVPKGVEFDVDEDEYETEDN